MGLTPRHEQRYSCATWLQTLAREAPKLSTVMKLRDHPLMSYRGRGSWPPAWIWVSGVENDRPKGEVGILRDVKTSHPDFHKCILYIEYNGAIYRGSLFFDSVSFCAEIVDLLKMCRGQPVEMIGGLDLARTGLGSVD